MTANLDNQDETRMPLTSANVTAERLEKLKELFPEAFTEGKVDFERLRQALGDVVDTGRERYGLSWATPERRRLNPAVPLMLHTLRRSVVFEFRSALGTRHGVPPERREN